MQKKLTLDMFAKTANKKETKEVEKKTLNEINNIINIGRLDNFNNFGEIHLLVECILIDNNKKFKVFYFKEVYENIKHLKQLTFVRYIKAITTQGDLKSIQIENSKKIKRVLRYNLDLCVDKIKLI